MASKNRYKVYITYAYSYDLFDHWGPITRTYTDRQTAEYDIDSVSVRGAKHQAVKNLKHLLKVTKFEHNYDIEDIKVYKLEQ